MPPLIYQRDHISRDVHGLNVSQQRKLDTLLYPPRSVSAKASPPVRVKIVKTFNLIEGILLPQESIREDTLHVKNEQSESSI